ncbi:hypothetical protein VNO80_01272 [Phaseolus coccineus]|uniref:Uncharacterized protein n=1 Tax=Phaseolus coccineus TaxID=3886 RepID=A0AAN9RSL0_PHACN
MEAKGNGYRCRVVHQELRVLPTKAISSRSRSGGEEACQPKSRHFKVGRCSGVKITEAEWLGLLGRLFGTSPTVNGAQSSLKPKASSMKQW